MLVTLINLLKDIFIRLYSFDSSFRHSLILSMDVCDLNLECRILFVNSFKLGKRMCKLAK